MRSNSSGSWSASPAPVHSCARVIDGVSATSRPLRRLDQAGRLRRAPSAGGPAPGPAPVMRCHRPSCASRKSVATFPASCRYADPRALFPRRFAVQAWSILRPHGAANHLRAACSVCARCVSAASAAAARSKPIDRRRIAFVPAEASSHADAWSHRPARASCCPWISTSAAPKACSACTPHRLIVDEGAMRPSATAPAAE